MIRLNIRFLGHSCFLIKEGQYAVLTDPFLTSNPSATNKLEDVHPTHVLVSHVHGDHLGDAKAIAKANKATVYSTFASRLKSKALLLLAVISAENCQLTSAV